jgi:hypothetical protein
MFVFGFGKRQPNSAKPIRPQSLYFHDVRFSFGKKLMDFLGIRHAHPSVNIPVFTELKDQLFRNGYEIVPAGSARIFWGDFIDPV